VGHDFWDIVDRSDRGGCHPWTGRLSPWGYGLFYDRRQRRGVSAHRHAYQLAIGEIPEGLLVGHRCLRPSCCNPAHLVLLTRKEVAQNRRGPTRLNKTGVRGVYAMAGGRFKGQVVDRGRKVHVGVFDTIEAAAEAVREARCRIHTANFGRRILTGSIRFCLTFTRSGRNQTLASAANEANPRISHHDRLLGSWSTATTGW
jgi:HNH endonuclease/AP2 domain